MVFNFVVLFYFCPHRQMLSGRNKFSNVGRVGSVENCSSASHVVKNEELMNKE